MSDISLLVEMTNLEHELKREKILARQYCAWIHALGTLTDQVNQVRGVELKRPHLTRGVEELLSLSEELVAQLENLEDRLDAQHKIIQATQKEIMNLDERMGQTK